MEKESRWEIRGPRSPPPRSVHKTSGLVRTVGSDAPERRVRARISRNKRIDGARWRTHKSRRSKILRIPRLQCRLNGSAETTPGSWMKGRKEERGGMRKKGGRGLLTTRLIRSMLLAFYTETFVSNTDFKKQTLLSQPPLPAPDTSVCSLFAIRLSFPSSLSLSSFADV